MGAIAVQEKVNGLNEQVENLKMSIGRKLHQRMRAMLTQQSVTETTSDNKLYRAVGRCFLLGEKSTIETELKTTIEEIDTELPKLTKAHQELEKRKDDAERELKEMV